jgi:hypothetical protein
MLYPQKGSIANGSKLYGRRGLTQHGVSPGHTGTRTDRHTQSHKHLHTHKHTRAHTRTHAHGHGVKQYRSSPRPPSAAAVFSDATDAPTKVPCCQSRDSYTSGTVCGRRPPKMTAEMGTPCGSSHAGLITGHCRAGVVKRELGCAAGPSAGVHPSLPSQLVIFSAGGLAVMPVYTQRHSECVSESSRGGLHRGRGGGKRCPAVARALWPLSFFLSHTHSLSPSLLVCMCAYLPTRRRPRRCVPHW